MSPKADVTGWWAQRVLSAQLDVPVKVATDRDDGLLLIHFQDPHCSIADIERLKRWMPQYVGTVIGWTSPNWNHPGHQSTAEQKAMAAARRAEEARDIAAREAAQLKRLRKAAAKVPSPPLRKKLPRARQYKEALRENPAKLVWVGPEARGNTKTYRVYREFRSGEWLWFVEVTVSNGRSYEVSGGARIGDAQRAAQRVEDQG
ncbi:MAG: hypothetical protein WCP53_10520 [Verrucomicrobiota bacterium]